MVMVAVMIPRHRHQIPRPEGEVAKQIDKARFLREAGPLLLYSNESIPSA